MGPETAAIAFAAAATGVAGASYLSQSSAARTQRIIDEGAIELQQEQYRLQAAEAASQNATSFRKALASQVALASLRGGSGSVLRQFTGESYHNFLQDQEAIKRGVRLSDIQAMHNRAQSSANQSASNLKGLTQFAGASLNAWNPNQFTATKAAPTKTGKK